MQVAYFENYAELFCFLISRQNALLSHALATISLYSTQAIDTEHSFQRIINSLVVIIIMTLTVLQTYWCQNYSTNLGCEDDLTENTLHIFSFIYFFLFQCWCITRLFKFILENDKEKILFFFLCCILKPWLSSIFNNLSANAIYFSSSYIFLAKKKLHISM